MRTLASCAVVLLASILYAQTPRPRADVGPDAVTGGIATNNGTFYWVDAGAGNIYAPEKVVT